MQFITNKKWEGLQQQLKALQMGNTVSMINNFSTRIFPNFSVIREIDAYQTMDMIYAVVQKLATDSALIPFYGYDKAGDTDLAETDKLTLFLNTLDFEEKEKLYTYLYLHGEVFAFKNKIELGKNQGLQSLRFLHPSRMALRLSNTFPVEILGYVYVDLNMGVDINIEPEDMIFIKRFNPSDNIMDEFRGLSAVKVLTRTLNRIQSGEDAATAQLQNGGVPGIVYNKTPGVTVETTGQRKDAFGRFLNNSSNKGAPYFAGDELGYIALGTPLTDMEVTVLAEADFDRVCNVFGISSILFNSKAASTFNNVEQMKEEMYENTIIPNVYRVEAALNKGAVPDIQTKGIIKCDTSEIKCLQADQTKLVNSLAAAWWLTPNEKREAQMYDQSDEEVFDKYIIPANLMLLDDLTMVAPVDNTAGDYQPQLDANGKPIKQPNQATVLPLRTGTNG